MPCSSLPTTCYNWGFSKGNLQLNPYSLSHTCKLSSKHPTSSRSSKENYKSFINFITNPRIVSNSHSPNSYLQLVLHQYPILTYWQENLVCQVIHYSHYALNVAQQSKCKNITTEKEKVDTYIIRDVAIPNSSIMTKKNWSCNNISIGKSVWIIYIIHIEVASPYTGTAWT